MNDKLKINLLICGTNYPMTIDPSEEKVLRAAAKQVESLFNKFTGLYSKITPIQAMTMTALTFATDCGKIDDKKDTSPYSNKINELSELVEKCIREDE
jgi:cell division protein ZapA